MYLISDLKSVSFKPWTRIKEKRSAAPPKTQSSRKKRGTGYGILNVAYGLAMLVGGVVMGFLYERSLPILMLGVATLELLSLPFFFAMKKEILKNTAS